MRRVVIEVTLKRHIWVDKDKWENGFCEELPSDMEDLEMLEDEFTRTVTELHSSRFLGDWIGKD